MARHDLNATDVFWEVTESTFKTYFKAYLKKVQVSSICKENHEMGSGTWVGAGHCSVQNILQQKMSAGG